MFYYHKTLNYDIFFINVILSYNFRINVVIKLYCKLYNHTCSEEKYWHLEKAEFKTPKM